MVNGNILTANQHVKNSNETLLKMRGATQPGKQNGAVSGLQIIQETPFNLPAASTTLT